MIDALEIFTHPKDLHILVGKMKDRSGWGMSLCRGPGHDFKPLVSSRKGLPSREKLIKLVRQVLESVVNVGEKELSDDKSLVGRLCNPENVPVEEADVLRQEDVERICESLCSSDEVKTYQP